MRVQLTAKQSIATALAAATCTLLGIHPVQASNSGWQAEGSGLLYNESSRVTALEPILNLQKTFDDSTVFSLNLTADSLTGASPNGASTTDRTQTFTSPSGKSSYDTRPGKIPYDPSFKERRFAISAGWDQPINHTSRYNIGAHFSTESDYTSFGFSGGLSRDFDNRNTTLSAGLSFSFDSVSSVGTNIPKPFTSISSQAVSSQLLPTVSFTSASGIGTSGSKSPPGKAKRVSGLILGLTQIISRRSLMQLNYSYTSDSGYLNDPYKIISILDPIGEPVDYLFEKRPGVRNVSTIYWQGKYFFPWADSAAISYRYMSDDWGMKSTTVDLHYRFNLGSRFYFEPHWRHYRQNAADFYHVSLTSDEQALLTEASADYRLAAFTSTTIGLKFGMQLSQNDDISLRVERYQQHGDGSQSDLIGIQQQYAQFPDLNSYIAQVSYIYRW